MLPPLPGVTIATYNSGASRAFLCTGSTGAMIDLTALISTLPGGNAWVLTSARAINDAGIIVGTGTYLGQSPRTWILYPTCQE